MRRFAPAYRESALLEIAPDFGWGDVAVALELMRRAQIDYFTLGVKFNLLPLGIDKNYDKVLAQQGWLTGLATIMPVGSAERLAKRLRLSRDDGRCLARLDVGINDDELAILNGPKWQQGALSR